MKIKIANVALLIGTLSAADLATANQVQIYTNKPMQVTYRVARENTGGQPEFDNPQTQKIDKETMISFDDKGRALSGIELLTVDGHVLPDSVHQFNKARQCSMTTNQQSPSGRLELVAEEHKLSCKTIGGVYGS